MLIFFFNVLYISGGTEQYVEENERLRAILGEWSTRAAKVLSIRLTIWCMQNIWLIESQILIF